MDMRQKRHETPAVTPTSGRPDESVVLRSKICTRRSAFPEGGSDAIEQALSRGKSEEFLVANRQAGASEMRERMLGMERSTP